MFGDRAFEDPFFSDCVLFYSRFRDKISIQCHRPLKCTNPFTITPTLVFHKTKPSEGRLPTSKFKQRSSRLTNMAFEFLSIHSKEDERILPFLANSSLIRRQSWIIIMVYSTTILLKRKFDYSSIFTTKVLSMSTTIH